MVIPVSSHWLVPLVASNCADLVDAKIVDPISYFIRNRRACMTSFYCIALYRESSADFIICQFAWMARSRKSQITIIQKIVETIVIEERNQILSLA